MHRIAVSFVVVSVLLLALPAVAQDDGGILSRSIATKSSRAQRQSMRKG